ncbi:hypothetical protein CEXT_412701 [Caerostris extrusa]|uniref:Uncharacterized protein n=1 Tax=Caerostris extrusa TaxID=172846 RepID=A0AAV4N4L3_CAEEX|nr:hypothetical protein CEXT_412701 [Caerostris extrusa]
MSFRYPSDQFTNPSDEKIAKQQFLSTTTIEILNGPIKKTVCYPSDQFTGPSGRSRLQEKEGGKISEATINARARRLKRGKVIYFEGGFLCPSLAPAHCIVDCCQELSAKLKCLTPLSYSRTHGSSGLAEEFPYHEKGGEGGSAN